MASTFMRITIPVRFGNHSRSCMIVDSREMLTAVFGMVLVYSTSVSEPSRSSSAPADRINIIDKAHATIAMG
eukprot:7253280-Prymnesium_polylepis.2